MSKINIKCYLKDYFRLPMTALIYEEIFFLCFISIPSFQDVLRKQPIDNIVAQTFGEENTNGHQQQVNTLLRSQNQNSSDLTMLNLTKLAIDTFFIPDEASAAPKDRLFKKLIFDGLELLNYTRESDVFSPYAFCLAISILLANATGETKQDLSKLLEYYIGADFTSFPEGVDEILNTLNKDKMKACVYTFYCNDYNIMFVADRDIIKDKITDSEEIKRLESSHNYNIEIYDEKQDLSEMLNTLINSLTGTMFNKIKNIPVDRPLSIINIVCFKVPWLLPFDSTETKEEEFFGYEKSFKVQMMKQKGIYKFLETEESKFLSLSLNDNNSNLIFVISISKNIEKMPILIPCLDNKLADRLLDNDLPSFNVELKLPKFKIETNCNMNNVINKSLGSNFLDKKLKLGNIFDERKLVQAHILNKTVIDINEYGICTKEIDKSTKYTTNDSNLKTISFICNTPFEFVLYYKTHYTSVDGIKLPLTPLLVGRYYGDNN